MRIQIAETHIVRSKTVNPEPAPDAACEAVDGQIKLASRGAEKLSAMGVELTVQPPVPGDVERANLSPEVVAGLGLVVVETAGTAA